MKMGARAVALDRFLQRLEIVAGFGKPSSGVVRTRVGHSLLVLIFD